MGLFLLFTFDYQLVKLFTRLQLGGANKELFLNKISFFYELYECNCDSLILKILEYLYTVLCE